MTESVDPKFPLPPCRICGSAGTGFHYGVNTCEACKGFFHRSLSYSSKYKCDSNNTCVIKSGRGMMCRKCRYQKCIDMGMSKSAIKTGRYNYKKKTGDILEVRHLKVLEEIKKTDIINELDPSTSSSVISNTFTNNTVERRTELTTPNFQDLFSNQIGQASQPDDDSRECSQFHEPPMRRKSQTGFADLLSLAGSFKDHTKTTVPFSYDLIENKNLSSDMITDTIQPLSASSSVQISSPSSLSTLPDCHDPSVSPFNKYDHTSPQQHIQQQPQLQQQQQDHHQQHQNPQQHQQQNNQQQQHNLHEQQQQHISHTEEKRADDNAIPWGYYLSPEHFDFNSSPNDVQPQNTWTAYSPLSSSSLSSSSSTLLLSPGNACSNEYSSSTEPLTTDAENVSCSSKNFYDADIERMFKDKEVVINALLEANKKYVLPHFEEIPKDEIEKQQREHYESCKLRKEMFGGLMRLPDHEYDAIYEVTGIDIDERQKSYMEYAKAMENIIRGMVFFAKSIPGFSQLPTSEKLHLIKYSRQEFCFLNLFKYVNIDLKVYRGAQHHWQCSLEMENSEYREILDLIFYFLSKFQMMHLSNEECVILHALAIMAPDRSSPINSPIVSAIYDKLVDLLIYELQKRCDRPMLHFAKIMSLITECRTKEEDLTMMFKRLNLIRYISLSDKPLLQAMFAGIYIDSEIISDNCGDIW